MFYVESTLPLKYFCSRYYRDWWIKWYLINLTKMIHDRQSWLPPPLSSHSDGVYITPKYSFFFALRDWNILNPWYLAIRFTDLKLDKNDPVVRESVTNESWSASCNLKDAGAFILGSWYFQVIILTMQKLSNTDPQTYEECDPPCTHWRTVIVEVIISSYLETVLSGYSTYNAETW